MRLIFFCSVILLAARAWADATPPGWTAAPAPLRAAVEKLGHDAGRWAYTQHMVTRDRKGRVKEDVEVRFDPSRHYDEHWTVLTRNGQPATEGDIRKFRRQRAKRAGERRPFGELLRLGEAKPVEAPAGSGETLVYTVPVQVDEASARRFTDKTEVRAYVDRATKTLVRIEARLLGPVRALLVARVKEGTVVMHFRPVGAGFAPPLAEIELHVGGSLAMVPVEQRTTVTRRDFKRVTPYDDRFSVNLAPLQTIDF